MPEKIDATSSLEEQPYYHGQIIDKEVELILQCQGEFMLRITTSETRDFTLSVRWNEQNHNFTLTFTDDFKWQLFDYEYTSITELIYHFYKSKTPLSYQGKGPVLMTPVRNKQWEIKRSEIQLEDLIGEGQFGEVFRAALTVEDSKKQIVAVKRCHEYNSETEKENFVKEANLMRHLDHPNIVKLIGICSKRGPILIIMEFIEGGSLHSYLHKNRGRLPSILKLKLSFMAAKGMDYLERLGFLHRDLAARNCLITIRKVLKLTDFGMSREGTVYKATDPWKIPWRWAAPETLTYAVFTNKSDVWSFGVMMWEIYSEGETPYYHVTNTKDLHESLLAGERLEKPEKTPTSAYRIMQWCWKLDPDQRPTFSNLKTKLDRSFYREEQEYRAKSPQGSARGKNDQGSEEDKEKKRKKSNPR